MISACPRTTVTTQLQHSSGTVLDMVTCHWSPLGEAQSVSLSHCYNMEGQISNQRISDLFQPRILRQLNDSHSVITDLFGSDSVIQNVTFSDNHPSTCIKN